MGPETHSRHSSQQSDGTVHSWRSERTRKNHRPYKRSEGSASMSSKQLASEDDAQWESYRQHLRKSKQSNGRSLGTLSVYEDERVIGFKQCWRGFVMAVTCCFPSFCLKALGLHDVRSQQAWREKMALIAIILLLSTIVGFLTFGLHPVMCPTPTLRIKAEYITHSYLVIHGYAYMLAGWQGHPSVLIGPNKTDVGNPLYPPFNAGGMDASFLFQKVNEHCLDIITPKPGMNVNQNGNRLPTYFPCALYDPIQGTPPAHQDYFNYTGCHLSDKAREAYYGMKWNGVKDKDGHLIRGLQIYYTWAELANTANLVVFNGDVLNIALLRALPLDLLQVPGGGLMEKLLAFNSSELYAGTDITHMAFSSRPSNTSMLNEAQCLTDIIKVGVIDTNTIGCITVDIVLYLCLIVILGMIVIKFACAVIFGWFLSWQLGNFRYEDRSYKERIRRADEIENWASDINRPASAIRPGARERKSILPQTSRFTTPDWGSPQFGASRGRQSQLSSPSNIMSSPFLSPMMTYNIDGHGYATGPPKPAAPFPLAIDVVPEPPPETLNFDFDPIHTICLVTCYSEGRDSIRTTLDSVATSEYPNSHKLILVVADGIITGKGNELSTPDICLSMMKDFVVDPDDVQSYSYVAIADGQKRLNMAKVYGGFYRYDKHTVNRSKQQRVPMITIVKCGGPEEGNDPKPGNRGKRDSQIILMSFLQKVTFDERMTMLEYDLFNMIWRLTGRPPDYFESILMVDADTKIYPDSLSRLVSCMAHDPEIMGLCGETKIGNKTDSWVTMIQVFEYYISHHQAKAFESIFGGVTCLPGCFCMYRIKAPKGPKGYWVPILVNPDVVEHYSEYVVNTLHRKNLLLLGEDRYLSTLMLKAFPKRKMMFVPQAVCKTVVPDTFQVLLSQRRRWINSTVHNLLELVLVRDLCGTFCFSMQFIVFLELLGTFVLPAAITFTTILIIMACLGKPAVIPLLLLAVMLGLPAILIVMTSRKLIYIGWMMIYLVSLPIWNLILPAYAFWHFDNFSWGETRQVDGEVDEKSHGDKRGEFNPSGIIMKRWEDFERERRKLEAGDEQQIVPAEADLAELRYSYQYSPSCYTRARSMSPPLSAYSHAFPHQPVITLSQASSETHMPHHLESVDEEYTDISDMHTVFVQESDEEKESDDDFH